jgi:hypothetical protein
MQTMRRPREAQLFGERDEITQVTQFHGMY